MTPITTASIPGLLETGLASVFVSGSKTQRAPEYPQIYRKEKSNKAQENVLEVGTPGLASPQGEGGEMAVAEFYEGITTNFIHRKFSLSFPITREAIRDNQYQDKFKVGANLLLTSLREAKEMLAISPFNNATNANTPLGDGQPLLSVRHPLLRGGYYSNTLAIPAELAEGSIEAINNVITGMVGQNGFRSGYIPEKLLIGSGALFTVERIMKSSHSPGSNINAINPIRTLGLFPGGYAVNHYMEAKRSWFVLTDAKGFIHYQREEPETSMLPPTDTRQIYTYMATERYSFGCTDPRSVAGCLIY